MEYSYYSYTVISVLVNLLNFFLNQVHAGHTARTWFLKIDSVRIVGMRACMCVCVCVSAPEAINN